MSAKNNVRRRNVLVPIAGILSLAVLAMSILGGQALRGVSASQQRSEIENFGDQATNVGGDVLNEGSPSWLYKLNNKYHEYENGTLKVRVGAGGPVAPFTWYFPKYAEINEGETVVWKNPT